MKSILILTLLVGWLPESRAALLIADDFTAGVAGSSILGLGGGIGFSSNWQTGGFNAQPSSAHTIGNGSLAYSGLPASGQRMSVTSSTSIVGVSRGFSQLLGVSGTTRYISLLLRPEGVLHGGVFNGFFGLALESETVPGVGLFIGKGGSAEIAQWVIEQRGGSPQMNTGIGMQVGSTAFLVLKAQFRANGDQFTLFVNPTPGAAEPRSGTAMLLELGNVSAATIYSSGAFSVDGLKIGDTYASVTAVPEPNAILLGATFLAGCLIRRNRALLAGF